MRNGFFACTLAFMLLLLATAANAQAESPEDRVKEGVGTIVEQLKDPAFQDPAKREAIFEKVSKIAEKYFDYKYLTMMAVGVPWRDMDDATKEELVPVFRKVLELNYMPKLEGYSGQQVHYKKELVRGDKAMVLTDVVDKDKKISVNYRLVNIDGQWMVYDIIAEGISLVKNYRSQFAEILHSGDAQTLIEKLRQKAAQLENAPNTEAK